MVVLTIGHQYMTGVKKNIAHLLFAVIAICLFCFKWKDMQLPYFWDELGVYSQAIDYQVHHCISLAPSSVMPEFSRGHPLLFTFINAMVLKVFGERVFVAHLFCIIVSILLLLAVYLKVSKYFNHRAGLASAVLIAIQPLFLAQSGLVLPEIMLTLFIFMALCSYYESRFWLFALFASLAVLTKETAIILPLVVIFYSISLRVFLKTGQPVLTTAGLVWTLTPYLVFGGFLLLQRHQNGWYFFPFHINSVSFVFTSFAGLFKRFARFIFLMQGRNILTFITVVMGILSWVMNKPAARLPESQFLILLTVMAVAFLILSSLFSVYMARYVTPMLIIVCTVAGVFIASVSENNFYMGFVLLLLSAAGAMHLEDGQFNYDADLGYRTEVKSLQTGINALVETAKPDDSLFSNFPGYFALRFTEGGYLKNKRIKPGRLNKEGNYYLLLCEPGAELKPDTSLYALSLLKRFDDAYAHTKLYRVRKKLLITDQHPY